MQKQAKNFSVLVVEDSAGLAFLLCKLIESWGFVPLATASSVDAALSVMQVERPDVVLLDIKLKGCANGLDLAAHLRDRDIPFIFISGIDDAAVLDMACSLQPVGVFPKPFDARHLKNCLLLARERVRQKDPGRDSARDLTGSSWAHGCTLPPRLARVAALMMQRLRSREIAQRLGLSLSTVRTYEKQVLRAAGVHNRCALGVDLNTPDRALAVPEQGSRTRFPNKVPEQGSRTRDTTARPEPVAGQVAGFAPKSARSSTQIFFAHPDHLQPNRTPCFPSSPAPFLAPGHPSA